MNLLPSLPPTGTKIKQLDLLVHYYDDIALIWLDWRATYEARKLGRTEYCLFQSWKIAYLIY